MVKVTRMADLKNDNTLITPLQMLVDAADEVGANEVNANRAIVLLIEHTDEKFIVRWRMSNCPASVAIAAAECFKVEMIASLGYVQDGEADGGT